MDLGMVWDGTRWTADLALADGVLALDGGLLPAVVVSLFSDRRARPDDPLPYEGADRRGWWGDAVPVRVDGAALPADRLGSRLWLLGREKQLPAVLARAREYAEEALAWIVELKVADRVDVAASIPRPGVLGLAVAIARPQGDRVDFAFELLWTAEEDR